MSLVVRVFVEVETEDVARHLASQLGTALAGVGRVVKSTVKPYWEITEYHEVMLVLDGSPSDSVCREATALLGMGWEEINADCAVWNAGDDTTFYCGSGSLCSNSATREAFGMS